MTAVPSHCGAGFETEAGDKSISHMYFKNVQGPNERLVIRLLNGPFNHFILSIFYHLVVLIYFNAIRL